jgi:hypothetical protein
MRFLANARNDNAFYTGEGMKERAQPAPSSPFSTTHGSVIPNEAQRNEESPTCISGGGLCMIVGESPSCLAGFVYSGFLSFRMHPVACRLP